MPGLLQHFQGLSDQALMEDIASSATGWDSMRIRKRISYAVKTRLLMNAPFIGALPNLSPPSHHPSTPPLHSPHSPLPLFHGSF